MAGVFIFRRDLRIDDNIGLQKLLQKTKTIIPVFVFTPEQLQDSNPYKSDNSIAFMIESLQSLESQIKAAGGKTHPINYFYDTNINAVKTLLDGRGTDVRNSGKNEVKYLAYNLDWTPYAKTRDAEIEELCKKEGVEVITGEDYTLHPMGTLLKKDKTVFKVFGPFRKNAETLESKINNPVALAKFLVGQGKITWINNRGVSLKKINVERFYHDTPDRGVHGGRNKALKILEGLKETQSRYSSQRDSLSYNTTHLSSYIKFGNVSIREVFYSYCKKLSRSNGLFSQLYWKEFYVYIAHYVPSVLQGKSMRPQYDKIKWNTDNGDIFEKWCKGMTGFPIVDAGMRELNNTGYMHNRSRLITSGFLVKLAIIDWREGEKYFAKKLTDYDPAQNNGGWQWSSGSGADSQPYFRILSPISQAKKNDPDAKYIKKWCPELADIPSNHLHDWESHYTKYKGIDYPSPCLDYRTSRKKVMDLYKNALKD